MRPLLVTFVIVLITLATLPIIAQDRTQQFRIETEPVAYLLGGAGGTASYQYGSWSYSIEAFGALSIPESLHGNQGFSTALKGVEVQVERFISGTDGFYLGPEFGISTLEVTRTSTVTSKTHTGYSVGLRGGYHWNTGLGNLYLSPVTGVSYALNSEDIQIGSQVFESSPVTPFATMGIGWSL